MLRIFILSVFLLAGGAVVSWPAEASAICQQGAGKCTRGTSTIQPATTKPAATKPAARKPAAKKPSAKSGSSLTAQQRAQIMERARELCRKKHGAPSRVYRVDYTHMRVWCEPPSY